METRPEIACRVCDCRKAEEWLQPREMMHGRREAFSYFRCGHCGCLQIAEVPANLGDYYPGDYYSLRQLPDKPPSWNLYARRRTLYPAMTRHKLGWGSTLGGLLCRYGSGPPVPEWLRMLPRSLSPAARILDIGCGSGADLLALRDAGFRQLLGADPFIRESLTYSGGVRILKCNLRELQGTFDLIGLHHVLEHMPDPLETLAQARRLLSADGLLLVRVPMADSWAAQHYRGNWVQLDAPRHLAVPTRRSMEIAAQKSELKIVRMVYDSTALQFLGSEQYLRDIPLKDTRSFLDGSPDSIFSPETINDYAVQAERLNREEKGDQAAFVLTR